MSTRIVSRVTESFRERWLRGDYILPTRSEVYTDSGRKSYSPERYETSTFVKGSGCCKVKGRDHTIL